MTTPNPSEMDVALSVSIEIEGENLVTRLVEHTNQGDVELSCDYLPLSRLKEALEALGQPKAAALA